MSEQYSRPPKIKRAAPGTSSNNLLPPGLSGQQLSSEESSIVIKNVSGRKNSRAGSRAGGLSRGRDNSKKKSSTSKKRPAMGGWDGMALGMSGGGAPGESMISSESGEL